MTSFNSLMKLGTNTFFVGFLGLRIGPSIGLLMSGTSLCSMKVFLRSQREGLPQLTFLHLVDVAIRLAETLKYMVFITSYF